MINRILLTALCSVMLCTGAAFAAGDEWSQDFPAAKKQAAAEKKDLLIDFTGSDWCTWCIKLNKEVFAHDAFKNGVKDLFVSVELDYPNDKSKQSADLQKQNEELLKAYPIKGYPTILLCDAAGKPFAVTGYQPDGPEKYIAHLNTLRGQKAARDEALTKAGAAAGLDKAKQLIAALEALGLEDEMISSSYPEVVSQIKEADPKDETGFTAKLAGKAKLAEFLQKLGEFSQKKDLEGALTYMNGAMSDNSLEPEIRQHMHGHKAAMMLHSGKPAEAMRTLEDGIKVAPDSKVAPDLKDFLELAKKKAAEEEKPAN